MKKLIVYGIIKNNECNSRTGRATSPLRHINIYIISYTPITICNYKSTQSET